MSAEPSALNVLDLFAIADTLLSMSRPTPSDAPANENSPVSGLRNPVSGQPSVHPKGRRGRGAVTNQSGRFERLSRVSADTDFIFDDGFESGEQAASRDDTPWRQVTGQLQFESARTDYSESNGRPLVGVQTR